MLNSLPATLTAAAVDAVVLDTVLIYTELAPMSLGMPYAHVANALHFDYSDLLRKTRNHKIGGAQ
jgi:hypothetical protein